MHISQRSRAGRRALLGVVVSLTLVAAACGSSNDSSGGSGGTDGGGGTATTTGDSSAGGGDAKLDPNATLRYLIVPPSTIDPYRQVSIHELTYTALGYDRLIGVNNKGEAIPALAESWEFSDDGKTFTLHLREGVKFQDGTPLDAAAVKASLERGLTMKGSTVAGNLASVASIDAPDATTVVLNLKQPDGSLPLTLAYNTGEVISAKGINGGDLETQMYGSGPYKMVSYTPGSKMVFERNEDYWDPSVPKLKSIEITMNTDPTATFNALRSGQADLGGIQPSQLDQAKSSGLNVEQSGGLGFYQFQMNRSVKPFDNEKVRQALNYAIDGNAILKSVAFGQGSVSGQIFPKDYFAYDESLGTPYPYDPDKAKQLLTEAGYPDGFTVDAALPATSQDVAEAMAAQLAEVGVKVNLKVLEPAQFAPEFFGGKVPAGIYTWTGRADPRQTMEALYSDTGFANPGQATTPEFKAAFDAAKVPEKDPAVEQDNIRKAARVVMEQALAVPVYQYFNLNAFNDQVVGMDTGVLSFTQLANLGMKAKG